MPLTRRTLLKAAAAPLLLSTVSRSLGGSAAAIPYGTALYWPDMAAEPRLGPAIAQWCSRLTPVRELKFNTLRPAQEQWNFTDADAMASFADAHDLALHGHTLVWYADLPDWVNGIDSAAGAEALMAGHIETLFTRYPQIRSWDVVNEAIPDVARSPSARRDGFWNDRLGTRHIHLAFELAHAMSPQTQLVLNEYDVEFATEHSPAKRAAFRNLIHELVDAGTPVHAIGFQGHLRGGWPIARDELSALVAEIKAMGLDVLVTELDVMDQDLPSDIDEHDAAVAAQVGDFLSAIADGGGASAISTWGLSDPYSWVRWAYPRPDGTANRPLPLDADFARKPFMDTIDAFRMGTL